MKKGFTFATSQKQVMTEKWEQMKSFNDLPTQYHAYRWVTIIQNIILLFVGPRIVPPTIEPSEEDLGHSI